MRLALHYRNKYRRERERSLSWWQTYGSPDALDEVIQQAEASREASKNKAAEAEKKVEKLQSEIKLFYTPNQDVKKEVKKALSEAEKISQEKVEKLQSENQALRARIRAPGNGLER